MDARMPTMPAYEGRLSRWGQLREWIRIGVRSCCRREGAISLYYPPGTWYAEHADEMLPLADLWQRRDYTPELYDLAWSFAAFVVQRFGRERYFAFYGSREKEISRRIKATLGVSVEQLEGEWHDHARQSHRITAAKRGKWDRYPGS